MKEVSFKERPVLLDPPYATPYVLSLMPSGWSDAKTSRFEQWSDMWLGLVTLAYPQVAPCT